MGTRATQGGLPWCPRRRGSTGVVQRRGPGAARGGSRRWQPRAAGTFSRRLGEVEGDGAKLLQRGIDLRSFEEETAAVVLHSAGIGEGQNPGEFLRIIREIERGKEFLEGQSTG